MVMKIFGLMFAKWSFSIELFHDFKEYVDYFFNLSLHSETTVY